MWSSAGLQPQASEPTGTGAEATVIPARREESEKSMYKMKDLTKFLTLSMVGNWVLVICWAVFTTQ